MLSRTRRPSGQPYRVFRSRPHPGRHRERFRLRRRQFWPSRSSARSRTTDRSSSPSTPCRRSTVQSMRSDVTAPGARLTGSAGPPTNTPPVERSTIRFTSPQMASRTTPPLGIPLAPANSGSTSPIPRPARREWGLLDPGSARHTTASRTSMTAPARSPSGRLQVSSLRRSCLHQDVAWHARIVTSPTARAADRLRMPRFPPRSSHRYISQPAATRLSPGA